MIGSFYRDRSSPSARENLSSLTPPRILAQRVQLRTVPWLFLFYIGFLFFFVLCTEWNFLFFLFFSLFLFFLRANIWGQPLNITGVKQDGRKRGVSYRTGRFVNGVNFFNPPRGCFLRFNSQPTRILMGAPLSTIFQPFSRLLTDETFAYDREFTRISSN